MADTTDVVVDDEMVDLVVGEIIGRKDLVGRLLVEVKGQGVSLVGPGGLLNQLMRNVFEAALDVELIEYLGHEHGGVPMSVNMRIGTWVKAVLTGVGRVVRGPPGGRDGSFELVIVPKRKRRLDGVGQIVLSLSARGLRIGEIAAYFEEVYGAKVSRDSIGRITENGRR